MIYLFWGAKGGIFWLEENGRTKRGLKEEESCSHTVEGTHTQVVPSTRESRGNPRLGEENHQPLNTGFSLRIAHASSLHFHGLHPSSVRAYARHPNGSISGVGA